MICLHASTCAMLRAWRQAGGQDPCVDEPEEFQKLIESCRLVGDPRLEQQMRFLDIMDRYEKAHDDLVKAWAIASESGGEEARSILEPGSFFFGDRDVTL